MEIKTKVEEKISSPEIVADIFTKLLASESDLDRDKEHFWSLGLKSNNCVKFIELISIGILNASLVHPREVFCPAITRGVASIVIVHNHPCYWYLFPFEFTITCSLQQVLIYIYH